MWGHSRRARNLRRCHFMTRAPQSHHPLLFKVDSVKVVTGGLSVTCVGYFCSVSKDQRGLHLLSHLLAAQRRDNSKSKLEAGPWPPAGEDQAVLLHAILRVAIMTLDEKRVTS